MRTILFYISITNRPNSPEKKVIAKLKIRTTSIFVWDSRALVIYLFISVFCVSGLAIVRVGIVWGAIVRVGNSPEWEFSGGQLSWLAIVRVGIVWGEIVRVGNCLGGNCPRGNRPGGNRPGGIRPGGSCPGTVLWMNEKREGGQVWNEHKGRRYKKQSQVLVLGLHKRRLGVIPMVTWAWFLAKGQYMV